MNDHENEHRVRELLSEAYPPAEMRFNSGFADRVMHAAHSAHDEGSDISVALIQQCRRLLPALLAASLALVAWNVRKTAGESDSLLTAALGIPSAVSNQAPAALTMLQGTEAFQ